MDSADRSGPHHTGTTATNNGHIYEVYSAANGAAAQLLIDQHMLMAHAG